MPKIEIVGEADLYVKAGSTVSLKCVITQALEEPAYIFWYHNDERVLNYDRSLVEIRMERLAPDTTVRLRDIRFPSILIIDFFFNLMYIALFILSEVDLIC